jgi:hypothetical protein
VGARARKVVLQTQKISHANWARTAVFFDRFDFFFELFSSLAYKPVLQTQKKSHVTQNANLGSFLFEDVQMQIVCKTVMQSREDKSGVTAALKSVGWIWSSLGSRKFRFGHHRVGTGIKPC